MPVEVLMLNFQKLTLEHIDEIKPFFHAHPTMICDNTVGGAFMWRDYFSTEFAKFNDTLIFKAKIKYFNDIIAFSMPLGSDVQGSLKEIELYCRETGTPVVFCTVTENDIGELKKDFNSLTIYPEENWNDYIYDKNDLTLLKGKKWHGQKNHINYFIKTNEDYRFEKITGENISGVKEFFSSLEITNNSDIFIEERKKVFEVLDNYEAYGLTGLLLRANGSVCAFALGEIIGNVLYVHIEKADKSIRGAHQMIVREFAAQDGITHINREEDVGDPGLRASKMSYHPVDILKKHIVKVN